ncbi:AbrB/MazE/SpoVT family DNA-binding domain-containing protein [Candidatus Gottesmanbacteria bacterium]|nr:AbrB/MazE/SpoVT family DNA-binding domain-containing protein [Candidatus Gottesmanbacteria bacterium]
MQTSQKTLVQEEWVKILGKGMITIPKSFREELNFREGEVAKIKKIGRRLIIEPRDTADYRIYTDEELQEMLKEDKLPPRLAKKAAKMWQDLE